MAELEATMSTRELLDWKTFEAMHEPLPDRLADLHISMVASLMVNIMRAAGSAPVPAADFFVIRDRVAPQPNAPANIDRMRDEWRGG